jgi:sugar lactone lactonase YvrE
MKKPYTLVLLAVALQGSLAPLRAQPPAITNQPASRAVWAGATVTFAAGVSGAGPFAYQWLLNGKSLSNGIIVTVAGGGTTLNGPSDATNSSLSSPSGVTVDALGNIFIADTGNNRVRQVGIDGIIRTVAGNGTWGYSGDGGLAIRATMMGPVSVASDASGNLFIGDNMRVRKVSTNGVITTVAGGGTNYANDLKNGIQATNGELDFTVSGVTVDTLGNLVVASGVVFKVATNGVLTLLAGGGPQQMAYLGDGGPATNAFLFAAGIAFDSSGDLIIADSRDNRIRYVNTDGIIASAMCYRDSDISDLINPSGAAVDAWGDVFVADSYAIKEINSDEVLSAITKPGPPGFSGDDGPATNASVAVPLGLALDAAGNLFIADTGNNRIRKITNTQGPVLTLNNIAPTHAGVYQLVVTGSSGLTTSSAATLLVATAPQVFQAIRNADGSVTVDFVSPPGKTNVVLVSSSLSPPILWQAMSTNVAEADGSWSFTDTAAANYGARFYSFREK